MSNFKNTVFIVVIIAIAIVDILIYWNSHLYYQARERIEGKEEKIEILEKADRFYPFNDLVHYELGKAYFDLGMSDLEEKEPRETYLHKSIQSFTRSLRINPASFFSHFNFAQSLVFMSYLSPSFDVNFYEEYRKAALLTGHNSQIFLEVGKLFLSHWPSLSPEDRDFTLEILKKILGNRDQEKLQSIMQVWDMNVKDYDVMEKILPADSEAYRLYAKFLGEKSLSTDVRQRVLSQAEFIEFKRAKKEFNLGQMEFQYFRMDEAFNHFKASLDMLKKISFYQDLSHQKLIDPLEFERLQKSLYLNLAKCRLEGGASLGEVEDYLLTYLNLEDKVALINEFEKYLREKGLIEDLKDQIEEKSKKIFNDLSRLSFEMLLYFKQNRYREIVKAGDFLQQSFIVMPEEMKKNYVKILQFVGDSHQKVDFVFEAGEYYRQALKIDPDNLQTLLRYRKNCEWLNYEEKIREIDKTIEKLLSPQEIIGPNSVINRGGKYSRAITLDGRKITLNLHFGNSQPEILPLISVFFNGRLIWENYVKDEVLSFPLNSEIGQNSLQIIPLNRAVYLHRITVSGVRPL